MAEWIRAQEPYLFNFCSDYKIHIFFIGTTVAAFSVLSSLPTDRRIEKWRLCKCKKGLSMFSSWKEIKNNTFCEEKKRKNGKRKKRQEYKPIITQAVDWSGSYFAASQKIILSKILLYHHILMWGFFVVVFIIFLRNKENKKKVTRDCT